MKWLALHVGGQKWGVYLMPPTSKHLRDDAGETYDGRCVYSQCRIYINRELDEAAREDALLHELLHAILSVCGGGTRRSAKAEEILVTAVTPILHRLLKDLGFRFPKGITS